MCECFFHFLFDVMGIEVGPVSRLSAGGDELVGVENHDLVLVGLVHQYAVHRRCVRRHYGVPLAHQPEHALHLDLLLDPDLPSSIRFLSLSSLCVCAYLSVGLF